MGFEPTEPVKAQRFSRPPRSTTPAPLRAWGGEGGVYRGGAGSARGPAENSCGPGTLFADGRGGARIWGKPRKSRLGGAGANRGRMRHTGMTGHGRVWLRRGKAGKTQGARRVARGGRSGRAGWITALLHVSDRAAGACLSGLPDLCAAGLTDAKRKGLSTCATAPTWPPRSVTPR